MGQLTNPNSTIQVSKLQEFYTQLLTIFYQKPATGIPVTDLAEAIQSAITAAGTALQPADLDTLNGKVAALEALISEDPEATTHAIDKFNEIVAFLAGITDTQTLDGIIAGINDNIAAKYTKPSTGIPATDLAQSVQDILDDVDNKVDKVTGKGLSTNDYTDADKAKVDAIIYATSEDIQEIFS